MPSTMARTEWSGRCVNSPGPGQHPMEVLTVSERTCSIDGCERRMHARTWCITHYSHWRTHGYPVRVRITVCTIDGCARPHYGRGWCQMHWMRWRTHGDPGSADRLRGNDRRILNMFEIDESGCWIWQGDLVRYGRVLWRGRKWQAHRAMYSLLVGPIPGGLTLDHLCRVPACVNPEHLEPVTQQENNRRAHSGFAAVNARKTHCPQGHPYDEANTYRLPGSGSRVCRVCLVGRNRRRSA